MNAAFDAIWPYLTMLVTAFGAATLLPFSSELALAGLLKGASADPTLLVATATIGNVAGSALNWWIGARARSFETRPWFPFTAANIEAASQKFNRFGVWSLLLSWVPVVGDPLTFVAGVLRVPFLVFLPLVLVGKLARYLAVVGVFGGFSGP
jgi:membrane protein YqaA with SNARE-associated domain